jgi:epoxyqueuosine reductase
LTLNLESSLKKRALALGFDLAGIAPASALPDLEFCRQWLKNGYGGEMHYLANPKRQEPRRVLPSVKSIICVGLIYNAPQPYSTEIADPAEDASHPGGEPAAEVQSRAWISRYAWGSDYHDVMRGKLEQLRAAIEQLVPGVETRVYVDTGPVVERAFARVSGIGWMGKNTCLINEEKGSWFFLGVILTSLELAPDVPAPDRCGSCTRCLEACPAGAFVEPYVMDASRCISYFNIELKGPIPEKFRTAMGRNVFGCDICQDVCPWNGRPWSLVNGPLPQTDTRDESFGASRRHAAITEDPAFQPLTLETKAPQSLPASAGAANVDSSPAETFTLWNPSLEDLAALSEDDFRRLFAHSPIKRVKYRGWLRNLCVAMGNSGDCRFVPWLEGAAQNPDPTVREHAHWALQQLRTRGE